MALKPASLQWAADGVLRNADYGDIYFQPQLGPAESHYVFLEKNELPARFAAARNGFRIAELGFGTGLNFLLTADLWRRAGGQGELVYVSIEKHPIRREDLARIFSFWPDLRELATILLAQYPPALEGFYHLHFPTLNIRLMLCLGDVAAVLPQLSGVYDAWYLDGFAPAKNPDMWDDAIFSAIAARTAPGGTLATFSSAGGVRRGLAAASFFVEKVQGFGVKRDMTVARFPGTAAPGGKKQVTVLGAGLGGASVAYAAAQKGCEVTVIDRQPAPALETSGNPVGVLYPKLTADRSPLGSFFQHGFFFTRNLVTALGLSSWRPCGVEDLDTGAEDAARHKAMADSGYWPEDFMRYRAARLDLPYGGCLSPAELCRRLLDHPRIRTVFSKDIVELPALSGDVVVALALGTNKFPQTSWLPLVPVRGQVTYLKATPASAALDKVVCYDGAISPQIDGFHYAGATFSREPWSLPAPRPEDDEENLANLVRVLPQFGFTRENIVGARAGFRTSLPDHLPAVGPCPDIEDFRKRFTTRGFKGRHIEGLYIATGFGGQGLSGAPLTGEIIANQITGAPLPVPQELLPYLAPERFIIRDLKRGKI